MTVPIVELAEVCDRLVVRNRALFETLGRWVADESDPAAQQWFSVAAHRHAWHADLWSSRRPAIPVEADIPPVTAGPGDDHVAWYRSELDELARELDTIRDEVDATLDPSTARVLQLVGADLDDLVRAAPAR